MWSTLCRELYITFKRHLFSTYEMPYIQERCVLSSTVHWSEQLHPEE